MKKFRIRGILAGMLLLIGISYGTMAQKELKPWQHKGYILDPEGNKIEGVVELDAWGQLWRNQATIGFCSQVKAEEAQKAGKKKLPVKWYKATALKGYGYDNKQFVTKKVKLDIGIRERMLEPIAEKPGCYKFYNSTIPGATPPQSFITLRENSEGVLE